ncbi:MAG: pyridoxal-phosphate dependent enzyme [Desulfobulbaceae bacterium]|nr:pyridoxal-phosphate dependent enzyme [Desulfobulbaceae bacterium]
MPKTVLADLPTPVAELPLATGSGQRLVSIKYDDRTGKIYGGNKVRKLEYLLQRAVDRNAKRVATFGTVASNHALATSLYANSMGLGCTCLLFHQVRTPNAPRVLNMHLQNETELVRFGGKRGEQVSTMRRYLRNRHTWVIPAGGSSWLGVVGFVNAALELAEQIASGEINTPDRLYVANGTMGTAAGIALGLALAELPIEVHAVRVTYDVVANPSAMRRLMVKTATLLNRLDASIPAGLADRTRMCFRDEFFAGGYAHANDETVSAVNIAREQLKLELETTYTGKAMAALLHDIEQRELAEQSMLFWNTYSSRPLPVGTERPDDVSQLPAEFLRYYD